MKGTYNPYQELSYTAKFGNKTPKPKAIAWQVIRGGIVVLQSSDYALIVWRKKYEQRVYPTMKVIIKPIYK